MNTYYHLGKLGDHIKSNEKLGLIGKNLRALSDKNDRNELNIKPEDYFSHDEV